MNVLWVTPVYPNPHQLHAGVFCRVQAQQLARGGIPPKVLVTIPYVPPMLNRMHRRYAILDSLSTHDSDGKIGITRVRYFTTPKENRFNFSHLTQYLALSRQKLSKPDLIHAHFAYPTGAASAIMAKRWNIPLILTLYGDDVTIHPYVSRWHRKRFAKTIHAADYVIALSEALADQTETLSHRKPDVLSAGVELTRFNALPEKRIVRKHLGLPENAFVLMYIGSLWVQRGVEDLANAFQQIGSHDMRLIFIGDGPCKPAGKGMIHLGNLPNSEIPWYLSAADVLVLPSPHEGLGQVILEAAAARVPVIGAATGGIVNLLSHDRGWLFPPRDVEMLKACILQARQHPMEAKSHADALYRYVSDNHEVAKNGERLIRIYQDVKNRSV